MVDSLINALNVDINLPPPPPCLLSPFSSCQEGSSSFRESEKAEATIMRGCDVQPDDAIPLSSSEALQNSTPVQPHESNSNDIAYSTIPKMGYVSSFVIFY